MFSQSGGHRKQCLRNENVQTYLSLKNPNFIDWEITTIFYASLQVVDDYLLSNHSLIPANHFERIRHVRNLIPTIRSDYNNLKMLSEKARYISAVLPPELTAAKQYYGNIKNALQVLP